MGVPIRQMLIPTSKYWCKSDYAMTPKGIVFHNTAGTASAMAEASYMSDNNYYSSMHIYVDETEGVQTLPWNRNAWHATDGTGANSVNRNYIGLEVCRSRSALDTFKKAEQNAFAVCAQILKQLGLPANATTIRFHREVASTACPHRSIELGDKNRVIKGIQAELDKLNGTGSGSSASTGGGLYRVQSGAFGKKANADSHLAALKVAGFTSAYCKQDGALYKVQLGAFGSKANAQALMALVQKAGFDAYVREG